MTFQRIHEITAKIFKEQRWEKIVKLSVSS